MKSSIALVGFMASGKSTVGRILAASLGKRLVSTDRLVETRAGKPISQIFETEGETGFRRLETEVIKELVDLRDSVIDCGGGAVLETANTANLKQEAVIVYLTVSPEEVLRRLPRTDSRPLLMDGNRTKTIGELLERRRPLYENSADFTLDTSGLTPQEVAARIFDWLKTHEGQG